MPLDKVTFQKDWYDRLVSKTNEKTVLPDAIKSLVSDQSGHCLEIGLGTSPFFAQKLADQFDKYTILEKETGEYELPTNAEFIVGDWESYGSPDLYDVILASHVVYYFDDKRAAIDKMVNKLTENGKLLIVVNGCDGDYGPLKLAFSAMVNHPYTFTYDVVKAVLDRYTYTEHSFPTTIPFSSGTDLFETLRLSFDQYPDEYEAHKDELITYYENQTKDNLFVINQKVFVIQSK